MYVHFELAFNNISVICHGNMLLDNHLFKLKVYIFENTFYICSF